jgi:hypothetical protein
VASIRFITQTFGKVGIGQLQSRVQKTVSVPVRHIRMSGDKSKYNVVFVLGGPGAGKGTQCVRIDEVCVLNKFI